MSVITLTRAQEEVAFRLIAEGDEQAREMFVRLNQPLVTWCAKQYKKRGQACGLTWEELLSAGNVGLLKAINIFDYRKGFRFSTCAVPWIKGEITALFKANKSRQNSDKRIRQSEFGVPLVFTRETATDDIEDDDDVAEGTNQTPIEGIDAIPDLPSENADAIAYDEFFHPGLEHQETTLEEATDLHEVVVQEAEGFEKDGGESHYHNATQARGEGLGSFAGCAEFGNLRGEDMPSDPLPGSGLAINFASDRKTSVMGVDNDLRPALEEAIERLEDSRHKQILRMYFGLCGEERHTLVQIGESFCVSLQRVHVIQKEAIELLREMEDPALELLFEGMIQ